MIYNPELWRDIFVMVGGGAAALSGLVFVAMSLNLESVVGDATHRNRAVGTLAGFTYSFILCGLALMGRPGNVALGVEWLVLSGIGGFVYVRGYIQASTEGGSRTSGTNRFRNSLLPRANHWLRFAHCRIWDRDLSRGRWNDDLLRFSYLRSLAVARGDL